MIKHSIMLIFFIKKKINKVSTIQKGIICSDTYIYTLLKVLVQEKLIKKTFKESCEGKNYVSRYNYSISTKGIDYVNEMLNVIK